jgi:hypothetical protein
MPQRFMDAFHNAAPWARDVAGTALDAVGIWALVSLVLRGCL